MSVFFNNPLEEKQNFTYLNIANMPKDNNGLEGFFSQLETKASRHRGLK
ncbi:MAG: hypothetical protein ABH867_01730 [Patescibacteria group bacterium]|nr:hypothetical protein [Patescibacteria group bacterium]